MDIREWDVLYHVRVMIDLGRRSWFYSPVSFADRFRYTDRKMVRGRGETRRYDYEMFRRATAKSGSSGDGIRYRDDEVTAEISRRCH